MLALITTAALIFSDSDTDSIELTRAALDALATEHSGTFTLSINGTFDLATRLQGRSLASEPTPITQHIVLDVERGAIGYEVAWNNYYASRQNYRQLHFENGMELFISLTDSRARWDDPAPYEEYFERFARYDPGFILQEILTHPDRVSPPGQATFQGQVTQTVSYQTLDGEQLRLHFNDNRLIAAQSAITIPVLGDTELTWAWTEYGATEIGVRPQRIRTYLGEDLLMDAAIDYRNGDPLAFFTPDLPIEWPEPPPLAEPDEAEVVTQSETQIPREEIAPGVHFLPGLRPGFHGFLVETGSGFVAIDAPAGWFEMHQIPPMNWQAGNVVSDLGSRMLAAAHQINPEKPVSHLILTHHHNDHMGGVRPFIAEEVEIIAGENAARYAIAASMNPFEIMPDRLTESPRTPQISVIYGDRTLELGGTVFRLLELPDGNPKADGYLIVYLPETGVMLTTGFIYPIPDFVFPLAESIPLSEWFVSWLDNSGLEPSVILNVHGMGVIEPWQLDYFRNEPR